MRRTRMWVRALFGTTCAGAMGLSQVAGAEPPPAGHHPVAHPHHPAATHPRPAARPTTHPGESGASRRAIAGGSTSDDVSMGAESPELHALRDAERELFPAAMPAPFAPWPSELPSPLSASADQPRVHASGLPPAPPPSAPPAADGTRDLGWLSQLTMPDLPVRWDPRVVRYLEFFKDDARGRATFSHFFKRSGRYRDLIKRALRKKGVPEDLVWVAMVESGFDPTIRSPAGALGLWQFMPDAGKSYGLAQDRWIDQRLSPPSSTEAAADFLNDLHRRFGSWDLALASYNMGYGGMTSVVRRYNTNDFWALSHTEGSLPWETTLYVPKILAVAVVAKNLAAFGFADLTSDAAVEWEEVHVPPGTALATVAAAAGCTPREVESLNPELRASRTPPSGEGDSATYAVRVPVGKAAAATASLAKGRTRELALDRYVVRFGETLDQVAALHKVTVAKLVELNGIAAGEVVRGGAVLLVPRLDPAAAVPAAPPAPASRPVVIVPADTFSYPDRKRVFYRVLVGDTLKEIASSFAIATDELRRWNNIDPQARLIEGMTLQMYVPKTMDLAHVVAAPDTDVRVVAVGSDDFFAYLEAQRGLKRITVAARSGETIEAIGKRYQVPAKTMERINRRSRGDVLKNGEVVVLYVPVAMPGQSSHAATAINEPSPNGPIPSPPIPDVLPPW